MELYREIEKRFPILEKRFSQENLLEFINTPEEELYLYHFGLGTWIRNKLLYSKDSLLHPLFLENRITHEDDMSSIIIQYFHQYITNKNAV